MSLPRFAIADKGTTAERRVEILQCAHGNYFDVLYVKGGKERRVLYHRSRLTFIKGRR